MSSTNINSRQKARAWGWNWRESNREREMEKAKEQNKRSCLVTVKCVVTNDRRGLRTLRVTQNMQQTQWSSPPGSEVAT